MTPFDSLGALLDRLHKRSPLAAFALAILIAFLGTIALAYLNADGADSMPVPTHISIPKGVV